MQRTCATCGKGFEGKSSRATYCAARCRVAANRARKRAGRDEAEAAAAAIIDQANHGESKSLTEVVRDALASKASDPRSALAATLAARIDAGVDLGSHLAALSKELRTVLVELGAQAPAKSSAGESAPAKSSAGESAPAKSSAGESAPSNVVSGVARFRQGRRGT